MILNYDINSLIETLTNSGIRYRIAKQLNSNTVSIFFGLSLISIVHQFMINKKSKKYFYLIVMLTSIFLIILNGSRGNIIALILSGFIIIFLNRNKIKKKTHHITIPLLMIIILISNYFYMITNNAYLKYRFIDTDSYSSLRERISSHSLAGKDIYDSNYFEILIGHGIGSFGFLLNNKDETGYPHNIFIEMFYELGLIYMIVFFVIIFNLFIKIKNKFKKNKIELHEIFFIYIFFYLFLIAQSTGDFSDNFLFFIMIISVHKLFKKIKSKNYEIQ